MNTIVNSVCPSHIANELLRIARIKREWLEVVTIDDYSYEIRSHIPTVLERMWAGQCGISGACESYAVSTWLIDGPKVFQPSSDMTAAMEEIEILIEINDYCQPYPAVLIQLPREYEPFRSVLCHRHDNGKAVTVLLQRGIDENATTIVMFAVGNAAHSMIETKLKEDCDNTVYSVMHNRVMRVALNSCLCLCNFGCRKAPMFAKQVNDDRKLASEQSDRGARARDRLKVAPYVLSFDQEVVFADRKQYDRDDLSEPTGREVSPHWRKGHWRVQRYGAGLGMKKNVLIRPVLVRADKFVGEKSDTSVTYK